MPVWLSVLCLSASALAAVYLLVAIVFPEKF